MRVSWVLPDRFIEPGPPGRDGLCSIFLASASISLDFYMFISLCIDISLYAYRKAIGLGPDDYIYVCNTLCLLAVSKQIGLMRSGHLLAEESPQNLLSLHGLSTLEDVFLKLCMKDGVSKLGTAPVVATITGGGNGYPVMATHQQDLEGHDNPAYAQSFNNPDAITSADIVDHHQHQQDEDEDHKALAQLSIVRARQQQPMRERKHELLQIEFGVHRQIPMGAQYWKNTKSILPVADEDGIVGLTFSPSGDSMIHTYSNKQQQQHINQMNAFNNENTQGNNDDTPAAAFDTKEGLFNLKHGGSSTNGSGSSTASCSSSSSNAGDTSSSCGSTAASSRAPGQRRSRTFKLAMPSPHRSAALIRKNFMQTFRNIG